MTVASPMTSNKCPLGDDCDLLIAYQHGADSMKDELEKVQAERDKLREALERIKSASEYYADPPGWIDATTVVYAHESTFRLARAALGETEND